MTPEEFRGVLLSCELRQIDAAWLCGVHPRQVRAWVNGEYPVPQYASLLLSAYAEGHLSPKWLASRIKVPPP
jgi:DNA-binding transcriptional regulator YdaS (Cro superfamily)